MSDRTQFMHGMHMASELIEFIKGFHICCTVGSVLHFFQLILIFFFHVFISRSFIAEFTELHLSHPPSVFQI